MKKIKFCMAIITMTVFISGIYENAFSQKATIELTFTAVNNSQYMLLDSIYVENLTQGGSMIIYAPESSLTLEYVGVADQLSTKSSLILSPNYPNPFQQQTSIDLFLPEKDNVVIRVQNLIGQEVANFDNTLSPGHHIFTFYPGNDDNYILTASNSNDSRSIKMVCLVRNGNRNCTLEYNGFCNDQSVLKSKQATKNFVYSLGDELRYIGYSKTTQFIAGSDVLEDTPQMDKTYQFAITEGIPCREEPFVFYGNKEYNTILVGEQCWLKQNIDYDTTGSWCYDNDLANCEIYGRLYNYEMAENICPPGWHLPSDEEWCSLTLYIDPTVDCGFWGWSGTDIGNKLKSRTGWYMEGNGSDQYGFSALPGGYFNVSGYFDYLDSLAQFWTSTAGIKYRGLYYGLDKIDRNNHFSSDGFSVRCMKGDPYVWSCGDTIHDDRDGQTYNTVEIGEQCWMAENINIGFRIDGEDDQVDNGQIEKYCYSDVEDSCTVYGGLYQWNEMMEYTNDEGAQGICPLGWHIPSDEEWQQLEGEADSQFSYPDPIWYQTGFRGFDVGGNLKANDSINWLPPNLGASNSTGFRGLGGGWRNLDGIFIGLWEEGIFWTSYEAGSGVNALRRYLDFNEARVYRSNIEKNYAFSLRCLMD